MINARKPEITVTDGAGLDTVKLHVSGHVYEVKSDPESVANMIHEINETHGRED